MPARRATAAVALVLLAIAGCSGSHAPASAPAPATASPVARKATPELTRALATGTAFLTTSGKGTHGFGYQLRAVSDGHVLGTVLQTAPDTAAAPAAEADGTVLLAYIGHCSTTLKRLDLTTGRQQFIRTIPESAYGVAVDPSGTRIAYLAYPECITYTCQSVCAGPSFGPPNVLVVMNLSTGRSIRTASKTRQPLMDLAWSPDGTQIAGSYYGDIKRILRFKASAPSFATARPLQAPLGCSYSGVAWTKTGRIITSQACGTSNFLSPTRLVESTTTGVVTGTWPVPACVNGVRVVGSADGSRTLAQSYVGYGNGTCKSKGNHGDNPVVQIAELDHGKRLRPVIEFSDNLASRLISY